MQDFVNFVRDRIVEFKEKYGQVTTIVEFPLVHPEIHDLFYGQVDIGISGGNRAAILDYKHGAGIAVYAKGNPQLRYYAAGFIYDHIEVEEVDMWICGRGPSTPWVGPVRHHHGPCPPPWMGTPSSQPCRAETPNLAIEDQTLVTLSLLSAKLGCPAVQRLATIETRHRGRGAQSRG
jgi:hypothetical protein